MESIDQKKLVTIQQIKGHMYPLCSIDNFITPTDEFYAVVEISYGESYNYNRYIIIHSTVLPNFDCENNELYLRVSENCELSILKLVYELSEEESNDIYERGEKRPVGERIIFTLNLNDTNTAGNTIYYDC